MKKAQKKIISVVFEIAKDDGRIATIVNGKKETEATPYSKGDYLVTGPLGETYPMAQETFAKRYNIVGAGKAKTKPVEVRGFFIPAAVEIIAEWGAQQKLPAGSFMIVNGDGMVAYGIDPDAFSETYEIIN